MHASNQQLNLLYLRCRLNSGQELQEYLPLFAPLSLIRRDSLLLADQLPFPLRLDSRQDEYIAGAAKVSSLIRITLGSEA